jgi:hypothetical protein
VRRIGALLAITIALSGCGGSSLDRSSVTAVTRRYFVAIAGGNGTEACSLLSASAKQSLGRSVKAVEAFTYKHTTVDCVKQVEAARSLLSPQARAAMRNVQLGVPAVSGRSATIRAISGSRTNNVRLVMTSDGWVIDGVAAQSSRVAKAGPALENQSALEHQVSAGEVKAATVDKRVRSVQLTLTNGRTVVANYGARQEAKVAAALEAKAVPVTILTPR